VLIRRPVLDAIADGSVTALFRRWDRPRVRVGGTLPFKRDVRELKELGLTESLDVGYRLSLRGRAYLGGC